MTTRTVVVGAGSAGAPLATRLSRDRSRDVVLVEAGSGGPTPDELLDAATIRGALPGHSANWDYQGELTPELPYAVARGKLLGGSSAINGGYFVRATPGDFERWARAGGPRWCYEHALPVLTSLETDLDLGDAPGHGSAGPMPVKRPAQENPAAVAFHAAAAQLGFPCEPDKNGAGTPGCGPVPSNIVDGVRMNTAQAYLTRLRPALRVVTDTQALRVVIDRGRVTGLETTAGRFEADEVVLCAGAIATPTLLMHSGVGPRAQLERFGIPVVADLPVGQAFADHPDVALGWTPTVQIFDPSEGFAFCTALNFDSTAQPAPAAEKAGAPARDRRDSRDHPEGDLEILLCVKPFGYLLTGSTNVVAGGARQVARHPVSTLKALKGTDVKRVTQQIAHGEDYQLTIGLQAARGRGRLTLQSADPLRQPRIEYRYLEDVEDRRRLRLGVRTAAAMLTSRSFAGLFDGFTEIDDACLADDDRLDTWIRSHLGTAIHMCGTAPMGQVVDGAGSVYGVDGLRVADTSILPDTPSRGPNATAVFIGELIARAMCSDGLSRPV